MHKRLGPAKQTSNDGVPISPSFAPEVKDAEVAHAAGVEVRAYFFVGEGCLKTVRCSAKNVEGESRSS
jgi:hypothetical protein